jgi:hypothetical protein
MQRARLNNPRRGAVVSRGPSPTASDSEKVGGGFMSWLL